MTTLLEHSEAQPTDLPEKLNQPNTFLTLHVSANSFLPWIVSATTFQIIRWKIEICSNYFNFLQFPNSKKISFRGKYSQKYSNFIKKRVKNYVTFSECNFKFWKLQFSYFRKVIWLHHISIVWCSIKVTKVISKEILVKSSKNDFIIYLHFNWLCVSWKLQRILKKYQVWKHKSWFPSEVSILPSANWCIFRHKRMWL